MAIHEKRALLSALDTKAEEAFKLQSALTAFQALGPDNAGKGEQEKADFVEKWLRARGLTCITHYDADDPRVPSGGRPNFVVTIPGRTSRTVWLFGHMDVVPAGDLDLWHSDPWTVVRSPEDPDIICGRGVEDNQQAMVSMCLLAGAIAESGVTPDHTLGLIFVSDEETGNTYGINHVLQVKPDLVAQEDLVVVPDSGSPDGSFIQVAEKGVLWLCFDITGRQCHASRPDDGVNALTAAAALILAVAEVEREFPARDPLFDPPRSTFTPTKHEPNVPNINTMPGHERVYVDCRVLPCYSLEAVTAAFARRAQAIAGAHGVRITVEPVMENPSAQPTSEHSPVVRSLMQAVYEVTGTTCRCGGIGGSTVAFCFRRKGIPSAVWSRILENCHAPNEAARLSNAITDAKVFASMLFEA
ncbi:MAG: M20 family metallo-hydrolase [Mailhella sp.]|jgi:succinyl-diaminopimelate desuccinylase|nr:M20 family metallo-hydrolase [Mailhella sp.]